MPGELRTFREAVALVTGGGSGIGAALARELSSRGARIVLADRHLESCSTVARSIEERGGAAEAIELDVRDATRVGAAVDLVFDRHGRLDYLFNNAGIGVGGESLVCTVDDWRYTVDVNLMGVVHGVQAAYPRMVGQGFGHIVNTASMAGLMPTPLSVSYGATKHAVVGLSRSLRIEAARYGVRVSVFCPGVIRTPILGGGRYGRVKMELPLEKRLEAWERLRPMEPEPFARRAIDQVTANREIIVVPSWWKAIWWLNRLSPALGSWFSTVGYRDSLRILEASREDPET